MPFPYTFIFDFDPGTITVIWIKTPRSYIMTTFNNESLIQSSIATKPYIKINISSKEED